MAQYDFLRDDQGNWAVKNGDFVVGPSDDQHIEDIIMCLPGEIRQHPTIGFGIIRYLKKKDNDTRAFVRNLQVAIAADGYKAIKVDVSQGIEKFKLEYE